MANHSRNSASAKDKDGPISKLGRDLRAISDKIAASGLRPLTRREVAREVAERRGAT
jgi:hypothetical protein